MNKAQRDYYGVPALLGNGDQYPIPIRATPVGSLYVTDNKKLLTVIKLELSTARNKQLIYEGAFNEITINIVDSKVQLNFIDAEDAQKYLSIVRPTSISTSSNKLWISNALSAGNIEIWLWG